MVHRDTGTTEGAENFVTLLLRPGHCGDLHTMAWSDILPRIGSQGRQKPRNLFCNGEDGSRT